MEQDAFPILLFTKVPGLVPVKTRLFRDSGLSTPETEMFASALLADTLNLCQSLPNPIFIATEPQCSLLYLSGTMSQLPHPPSSLRLSAEAIFPQRGANFGERLINAVVHVSETYSQGMLILGSDAPSIPVHALVSAIANSLAGEFTLGPCFDGGVYLLSLPLQRSRNLRWLETAFGRKGHTELSLLIRNAKEVGLPVTLLEHHTDIDLVER